MKKFDGIIRNASLNDLQKALYCRREIIVKLAKEGYSDFVIARYFCINPKVVRRTLKDSKDISSNRVTKKDELEKLLQERNEIITGTGNKSSLRRGFLSGDFFVKVDNIYQEFYACYWTTEDMLSYFKEVEGVLFSDYNIRKKKLKDKKTWSRNVEYVQLMLKKRYNACDIMEYLAVPEHVFDLAKEEYYKSIISDFNGEEITKEEKKIAKQEWIRLKSEERIEMVYHYRVEKKFSEEATKRLLQVSRATVHNDLKRYFKEHPEKSDAYCELGKRRRYHKSYK